MVKLDADGNLIIEGGYYHCSPHKFLCDMSVTDENGKEIPNPEIEKHESEYEHIISKGVATCQRCKKVQVRITEADNIPNPPKGVEPGVFCEDCKEVLRKQLGITQVAAPEPKT